MKKQKTNKVKTVVYLIHFILIDIWARNGVLHIFGGRGCSKRGGRGCLRGKGGVLWLADVSFPPPSKEQRGEGGLLRGGGGFVVEEGGGGYC